MLAITVGKVTTQAAMKSQNLLDEVIMAELLGSLSCELLMGKFM